MDLCRLLLCESVEAVIMRICGGCHYTNLRRLSLCESGGCCYANLCRLLLGESVEAVVTRIWRLSLCESVEAVISRICGGRCWVDLWGSSLGDVNLWRWLLGRIHDAILYLLYVMSLNKISNLFVP